MLCAAETRLILRLQQSRSRSQTHSSSAPPTVREESSGRQERRGKHSHIVSVIEKYSKLISARVCLCILACLFTPHPPDVTRASVSCESQLLLLTSIVHKLSSLMKTAGRQRSIYASARAFSPALPFTGCFMKQLGGTLRSEDAVGRPAKRA